MNALYRKAGFSGNGHVLSLAVHLGWLKIPDEFTPPDVPLLPLEQKTTDGLVTSLRDAITEYAVQQTEAIIKANEKTIYREARRRAIDALNEELEEMRPPKLIGRVRRTA